MLGFAGRPGRIIITLLGSLILGLTGVSIFNRPDFEVCFDQTTSPTVCAEGKCTRHYWLEVGNSGAKAQPSITIQVSSLYLKDIVDVPKAFLFGKLRRPMERFSDDTTETWILSNLEPGKRMTVSFSIMADSREDLPEWSNLLIAILPMRGSAHRGSMEFTMFGRFIAFFL